MITNPNVHDAIEQNTISALLNLSEDIPVSVTDIDAVADALWEKYKNEIRNGENRKQENTDAPYTYSTNSGSVTKNVRTITYKDKTMRFTVEKQGTRPDPGYPVFIALHGGGGTSTEENNSDWTNVQQVLSINRK